MISISVPPNNLVERNYIIEVIFGEFLGFEYKVEARSEKEKGGWEIVLENGAKLIVEDHFFNKHPKDLEYLKLENIPLHVKFEKNQFTPEEDIPVIFGTSLFDLYPLTITCGIDIFASSFFMLTRWEEYANKARDNHDRFPATESLAFKQGFLDRPVVNEYMQMLKNMLLYLDDNLKFKIHNSKLFISCDVDQPFDCTVETIPNLIRACAGDIIKRKSIGQFLKRIRRYAFNKLGNYKYDENYTFSWYMDVCEKAGLKGAFYFIPDNSETNNGCYSLSDKKIKKLISFIDIRNHEIGVHSSYQTYQNPTKMKTQKELLAQTLQSLHVSQPISGNRQHYLRWDASQTPIHLDKAGFEYDTTGTYADRPGFRYGVCYEFSMFDFLGRKKLKLKQRPLIVMECSVIDERYMGLGYGDEALKVMKDLKEKCYRYNGNFSLLWHNSHFVNFEDRVMFKEVFYEENP